ncbi:hypothetical protein [Halobacillus litoralis]|uniref:Uncharacterized protein n=1 Tax=Halobacillus litoralis TaxID=45668 RepID=A0A410MJA4_9BACI|nr:hypothetical protein [Halobacillus litoralis]QAS54799.1 hypothetical protein HLI_21325 [Halobacillus litoralis]
MNKVFAPQKDNFITNSPIAMSADFLKQLFNIEKRYEEGITYPIVNDGSVRTRKLHHITMADIMTAIILNISCNTVGEIRETNPHNLYSERMEKLYQNPVTYQEFKNTLKKFELNELILVKKDKYTKRYTIRLNHFVDDESGKVGRYIMLPHFVFSHFFTDQLSVSHMKLYLALAWQQGNKKKFMFTRVLDPNDKTPNKKDDIITSALKQLLHKQQNSDVKNIIIELLSWKGPNGQTLLHHVPGHPPITKRGRSFYKANLQLNPYFHRAVKKGETYRFPLAPKETYQREAKYIANLLNNERIGELVSLYNGSLFRDLLYILKDRSKKAIKHAILAIKEYVNYKGKFPPNIQEFTIDAVRHNTVIDYIRIAREEGILDYVLFGYKQPHERERRRYEFVSKVSYFSLRVFRRMVQLAKPTLQNHFGKTAYTEKDYESSFSPQLNELKGIEVLRHLAIRQNVSPAEYELVEKSAIKEWNTGAIDYKTLCDKMIQQVRSLNTVTVKPDLPYKFQMEDFMIDEYKAHLSTIRSS